MWLTRLCVQRPTIIFVLLALIAVIASIAIATITQQQFPNIDFPTVGVRASYPGASPTEIRDAIVRPLEDAIAGAPNLEYIQTTVQQGQASITATFDLSSNTTTDLVQVQRRVMIAQSSLPSDMPAPTVGTFDPAQATVLTIGLDSSALSPGQFSAIVSNNIVPTIEQVNGVSNVNANGAVTPAYEVAVNPNLLASAGYTLNDVVSSIQSNNNREPGGIAYLPSHETTIDVRGDLTTEQSVENLLISASSSYTTSFGNASYSIPVAAGVPGGVPAASSVSAGVAASNSSRARSLAAAATASPLATSSPLTTSSGGTVIPTQMPLETPGPVSSPPPQPTPPTIPQLNLVTQYATTSSSSGTSSSASSGGSSFSGPSLANLNQWTFSPRQMRISDVASVSDSFEPQRQFSYVGTVPTISLGVQKATGASEVVAARNVLRALPGIERQYPQIHFSILNDQAAYTTDQIMGVARTLSEAIVITAIVMLFFLRSWRNAIVILVAIPSSLGVTLALMRVFNFSIDTVSLLAMTLIIGILVDDSIVVLENTERHHANGE
ncbi:MAG TPA: efflux RND transporter permease subunit, partial [Candidatus Aquilonibacter sp.]